MILQYLGTAAAEAIPAVFCECAVCKASREAGGKSIRGRSGALIDGELMIDFPPDIYFQSLRLSLNLPKVRALIVTHAHLDHFASAELMMRDEVCYCHLQNENKGTALAVYGNETVGKLLSDAVKSEFSEEKRDFVRFERVTPFVPMQILSYTVTALPARHSQNETPFIYLVQKEGKSLLYAHDTGDLFEENYEYLKNLGVHLDLVSYDCTNFMNREGYSHMGIPNILEVRERLKQNGNLDEKTVEIVNHFSHNCADVHERMEEQAAPFGLKVSYDGMKVEI